MNKIVNFTKTLWQDEDGATAIEYGLLAALIAVVIITAVSTLGKTLNTTFVKVNSQITAQSPTVGGSS